MNSCLLMLAICLTVPAIAQPIDQGSGIACKARVAAVERDIDLARSKGQMLRRRQLGQKLAALQARCSSVMSDESRAANIERLEQKIRGLRSKLEQSEEQLHKLVNEVVGVD